MSYIARVSQVLLLVIRIPILFPPYLCKSQYEHMNCPGERLWEGWEEFLQLDLANVISHCNGTGRCNKAEAKIRPGLQQLDLDTCPRTFSAGAGHGYLHQ